MNRFCLKAGTLLLGFSWLVAFAGDALAQPRPIPAPSVLSGGGSSDFFPFMVGVLAYLTVLVGLLGFVLFPMLAKACGASHKLDEGSSCLLAIPVAIVLLVVLWQPLHLTAVSVWVTVAVLIAIVLAVVGVIATSIFQNWMEALVIGMIAAGAIAAHVKMAWGFWHSLLVGGGAGFGVVLVGAGIADLLGLVKRRLTNNHPQQKRLT